MSHSNHWDWVPATQADPAVEGEEVRLLHPDHPTAMVVKRLQKSRKDQTTVLQIDDESLTRMAKDFALHHHKSKKVLRSHLHAIVAKHVTDIVVPYHAPSDYWTGLDVSEPHDLKLEQFLREQFLSDEVIG